MTVHFPTIKQLQYLVALRQHGHFGKAAESCFVTQSTLSAGLRELENLLGVTLVERTRRVVRFTPLGEKIANKAVRLLRESEELTDLRGPKPALQGELRMGVIRRLPLPAAACCRGCVPCQSQLFLRGNRARRLRRLAAWPIGLRPARTALQLRGHRQG